MKTLLKLSGWGLLGLVLVAGWAFWWVNRPMVLRTPEVEVSIEPGTPTRDIARLWTQAGLDTAPELLYQWFRWSGLSRRIQAGSYAVDAGVTPRELLNKMVRGDQTLEHLRLIEGWNWRQVRDALMHAPHLRPLTASMSDMQVAAALGLETAHIEGGLFPDTYAYSHGVSDLTVLRRARLAMQTRLARVWAERDPGLPIATPSQLLTLASVVEKETGQATDRGRVAAVFMNRLRAGMPLQSDPTVIYGLGEHFHGNLRKADLLADSPWNTYTRRGLPATPIAMPGLASLRAAAKPDPIQALYFVAKGDGGSAFSNTLADHHRAVNQYQRGGER